MKTYKNIFIAMLALLMVTGGTTSCKKFLEERSPAQIPLEKSLTIESDAPIFLYGIYSLVKTATFGTDFFLVTEVTTDDMEHAGAGSTVSQLTSLTFPASNPYVQKVWKGQYAIIQQCNILIDKLDSDTTIVSSVVNRHRFTGEARFIRAWAYFNLVQLWGEVPLTTIPTYSVVDDDLFAKRASVDDIYAQIISDLTIAASYLPEGKDPYLLSTNTKISYNLALNSACAKLLLGKVYLVRKQWQDVIDALSYFATPGGFNKKFSLVTPYNYIFDVRYKGEASRQNEILWEIEALNQDGYNNTISATMCNHAANDAFGAPLVPSNYTRYQNIEPTYDLIRSYNTNDIRYRQSFRFVGGGNNSNPTTITAPIALHTPQNLKLYDSQTNTDNDAVNVPILRVADAYLMLAEAYNEMDSPSMASYFSAPVRTRAGLPVLNPSLTKEQMRDSIYLERRHEFECEFGYRKFDLLRTGRYGATITAWQTKQYNMTNDPNGQLGETFVDMNSGKTTGLIAVPFYKGSKIWTDKMIYLPIPSTERLANPNLDASMHFPNWN